ncbi:VOC family protein [Mycoplana dimorpha]|uniref:Putative 3-demethylubiquinone-9 3-methyltransferase (Glyoxalase superfamily) n=1 Tax=Mycoplana dimorpha TaxID=28320 RepID=A0A2T5B5R7_MYCDI|nr:VOC family protein [Mycoplana dimorpha]PTM94284.1 putative 3-demethylubiquinone-9 3-methyltransferase (glyoxalase superfamily) [Mycoplana dimorpha]
MNLSVKPSLMFQGKAEEAMNLYASLFPDCAIDEITRYGPGEPGAEGSIATARFHIGDQSILCIDSPVEHPFSFTPAFSLFVECQSEAQIRTLYAALSERGEELMPLGNYGFSREFAWINDRFGVSWQLNLR